MDPRGNIYEDDPDKIPGEDKARLEGFLRGRAEADERDHASLKAEQLAEQIARLEAERDV